MKRVNEYCKLGSQEKRSSEIIHVCFSCSNSRLITTSLPESDSQLQNFSGMSSEVTTEEVAELISFSLIQKIREDSRPPRDIIRKRVREVIEYINRKSVDESIKYRDSLIDYLYSYLFRQINSFIKKAGGKGSLANLSIILGINPFITNKLLIGKLQLALRKLGAQYKRDGYMRKDLQLQVTNAFKNLFADFLSTIEKKINSDKRGVLVPEL